MTDHDEQNFEAAVVDSWEITVGVPLGADRPKVLIRHTSGDAALRLSFTIDDFFRYREDVWKAGYISADGTMRAIGAPGFVDVIEDVIQRKNEKKQ